MNPLLDEMRRSRAYGRVLADLRASGRTGAENLWGASAALLVAALGEDLGTTGLCILPGVEDAERFAEDVRFFAPERLAYFPAWEGLDADDPPDLDIACERLILVRQLLDPSADPAGGARIIVAPVAAVLQHTATREELDRHTLRLCTGEEHGPERIAAWLVDQGFRRVHQVEVPGEFCRRGGILDVYPFGAVLPYRIEFFGDVIESIRTFDPADQTSRQVVERCEVLSAVGAAGTSQAGGHTLLDSLPERAWVALKEPAEVAARADAPETRLETDGAGARRLLAACERLALVRVSAMPLDGRAHDFETRSVSRFTGQLQVALDELGALARRCRRTVVLCNNDAEKQRLLELLADSPLPGDRLEMRLGRVSAGFESPPMGLALIPHHELFHRYQQRRTPPRYRHMTLVESIAELEPGDYVVHAQHGIGVYRGLKVLGPPRRRGRTADVPVRQECLCIEYRDGAMLYVPVSHIELVQKYAGPSERRPELSRLGGKGWSRRRERAAQAAEKLALEMLSLHAERLTHRGIAFEDDPEWQREFEAAFIYEETEDQLRVAEEVRRDMTSEQPMDRLICGDVGYGKTEIAMRAAFRAASNNTQVAVLVPTTVLAAQHHRTFCERMADYPLRIELLCRFRTHAEQKRILEGLADGTVDIVIGTHRLIKEDVRFRRLGLVIIDEEQRFGVAHKERLKRFHATVDVLTLTATPIPRTLHMSLLGLKDISNLETPPRDRLAIQTRLMRFEPEKIRRIILRELARDGQVFFVHNRVRNIEAVARRLRRIVPEARILVAHGQMPERQLEAHMRRFVDHEADVLVCTTIIESGLDIPNANTILIHRADDYGLADLHQLRGRVGRYRHRAYAYFLLPEKRPLTPVAQKRLKAIQEYSELGAGFKIALRDLELRGAGNILGPEQSGHIAAVGYDMYCRLLEHAIRRRLGRPVPEVAPVTIALGLETYLPEAYMPDPRHRIEAYRRLSRAATEEEIGRIETEWQDRFGRLPASARALLDEARLRLRARQCGIRRIHTEDHRIVLVTADPDRTRAALRCSAERLVALDDRTLLLKLPRGRAIPPQEFMLYLKNVLLPDASREAAGNG